MKNIKRILMLFVLCLFVCFPTFAYNPTVGSESIYLVGSPEGLGGGLLTVNTPLTFVTAENLAINPSLAAGEQRVVINASFSSLIDPDGDPSMAEAIQLGTIIPTKYGVFGGSLYFLDSKLPSYNYGTNFTVRASFSKDINEKLYVGTNLNFAFGSSVGANIDFGFNYASGSISFLPFLKEVNLAASLNSVGLGFVNRDTTSALYKGKVSSSPSIVTPRFGASGVFFSNEHIKAVQVLELSLPSFLNAVLTASTQVRIADVIYLKFRTEFNVRELIEKKASPIPSVCLSAKFGINTKDDSFLAKNGWQQSEVLASAGYRYMYDDIHAISAGFAGFLGLKDSSAPEITLW